MWRMIKNEWKSLSRNRTLRWVTLGFMLVLTLSVVLGILQAGKQDQQQKQAQQQLREQWENLDSMNPHGAAHYGTYVFKPSNLLGSLDEGVSSVTGNVLRVEGHVQNEMVYAEASQMQSVSKFGKLKSSLLLKYVLPLLLLFLAFDSVSREKQSGRLKLLVLQGGKTSSIVWAKVLSIWTYGLGLLTLTVLIYAALNLQEVTGEMAGRTLFFFLSYAVYYFVLCGLTVLFSARWQNATLALTSMLGIWMFWSIFLPSIVLSSVEKWHELPSRNTFKAGMTEDRSKGLDGHNPADERGLALEAEILAEYGVESLEELPINFDGIRMQADEEYGNQVWDIHFGDLRVVMEEQKRSYQWAGLFNPFISLQNASMGFAGSDNLHHHEFLVQAEAYRRKFIKTLNDEHAYGGSTTGDWGWSADNEFFRSVPDFAYQPVKMASIFPTYLPDILILLGWLVLVSLLLAFGTKRLQIL